MEKKWAITILISLIILTSPLLIRAINHTEIDDISPRIFCEQDYLEKSDVLWVIPKFEGIPISENQTWCKEILSLNKTIGLHGIEHTFNEFYYPKTSEEIEQAIQIFKDCFGFKPKIFKAPQLNLSRENEELLKKYNLTIKKEWNQFDHKVYHCGDTGIFSNKFIDYI